MERRRNEFVHRVLADFTILTQVNVLVAVSVCL